MFSSLKFKHVTDLLISKSIYIKNVNLEKVHKTVWNSGVFFISTPMRAELDLLTNIAKILT